MNREAKYPVQTSMKTLGIIEELKQTGGSRLTELADTLDMGKSNVHSHLTTLEEKGYVYKEGKIYKLSLKFLDIGGSIRNRMPLMTHTVPEMKNLASETGEVVNLLVEERGLGVYLHLVRGEQAVDLDTYPGRHTHLHNTALGKAILASMPDERVDEIIDNRGLPSATANTVTSESALFERLETVREQGFALDDEERLDGLRCVAAPIVTDEGVHGAISVSAPMSRMQNERFRERLPEKIKSATNVIEINIQYN